MSNRKGSYKKISERIELKDILKNKRRIKPLSFGEERELRDYLARKTLLLYDGELDTFSGNLFITFLKFCPYFISFSPSLFSEAMHSLADTCNQGL